MDYKKSPRISLLFLSMPLIWLPLPFVLLLDLFVEIYHRTCFPFYGIEMVKRQDYIRVWDRTKLKYLGSVNSRKKRKILALGEALGCAYCGYVNGVLPYLKEIANRTEKFWCGIAHQNRNQLKGHEHHDNFNFPDYNDQKAFQNKYLSK